MRGFVLQAHSVHTWEFMYTFFHPRDGFFAQEREEPDLGCYEDLADSDEEPPPPPSPPASPPRPKRARYPPSEEDPLEGSSQESYTTTPPKANNNKAPDFPGDLYKFLSKSLLSNRTFNAFCIMTTPEKAQQLYTTFMEKFLPVFLSLHKALIEGRPVGLMLLVTPGKHRASAVHRYAAGQCSQSFLCCRACTNPQEAYVLMVEPPYQLIRENVPGMFMQGDTGDKKDIDWQQLVDYALKIETTDPLLLLGYYLEFRGPYPCHKCSLKYPKHEGQHQLHQKNATLLGLSRQQKLLCQQACDQVAAALRVRYSDMSRKEVLAELFAKHLKTLREYCTTKAKVLNILGGVAWWLEARTRGAQEMRDILIILCKNAPKQRNLLFRGEIDTGKTCYAALFMNFLGGTSLNINGPLDKLNFELGCAIDKFMVVLEDVKGRAQDGLPGGHGVDNLDCLRDHLDGQVAVNLERKHSNKVSQIFPPSIITMNYYSLPPTLRARIYKAFPFPKRENVGKSLNGSYLQEKRLHTNPMTLMACLVHQLPETEFKENIREGVKDMKDLFAEFCTQEEWDQMADNCREGRDPLWRIKYDCNAESYPDSGVHTQ